MPRPRCRPGSGATRTESVFPTKREGPARGCHRHAMVVEALVPPGAARVAIRIATRVTTMYTNAPKRLRGGHFHRFVYTPASPRSLARSSRGATVYTNAPKWHRGAILANLCTLLRCRPRLPLAATEWQADRALDATVWHESRYMRSCQEMSCHSTPSSGTTIVHSVTASGTTEPRKTGVSQNASSWRPG